MKLIAFIFVLIYNLSVTFADYHEYVNFIKEQALNKTFVEQFKEHLKLFEYKHTGTLLSDEPGYNCDDIKYPYKGETTVHTLTPMDIKVIGAMGDSLTAGTGIQAKTVIGLINQYRGLSWSVGGDGDVNDYQSLPNIIKTFSPNVTGFSVSKGKVDSVNARLNVAVPGNKSKDMPGQAELLIERMKSNPDIDMENDWKIITVFIGGNDLCDYCQDPTEHSAERYMDNIKTALDILHENVPKAFVNLVEVLNIANVNQLNKNLVCDALHLRTCACGAYPKGETVDQMKQAVKDYQEALHLLVDDDRYDTRDDFTVVVQPFFRNTGIPKDPKTGNTDLSYFAPDCFHFSVRGQQAAATALWKNMMEPVGQKTLTWAPGEKPICPSQNFPFFYTNKNSDLANTENQDLGSQFNGENQPKDPASKPNLGSQLHNSDSDTSHNSSPTERPITLEIVGVVVGVCVLGMVFTLTLIILKRRRLSTESARLISSEISLPTKDI